MVIKIPLAKGKFAVIDEQDAPRVLQHKWSLIEKAGGFRCYAITSIRVGKGLWKNVQLHRFIVNPPKEIQSDHRDSDGLNNRRSNLRLADSRKNAQNRRVRLDSSSEFKGVSWHKGIGRWTARIYFAHRHIHLGVYMNEQDAARAYDRAAKELFGESANLNDV